MFKILNASKDAYITDRIIEGNNSDDSNVGRAGTLDLFKLYGNTFSGTIPNLELSRLLVHFDLNDLIDLVSAGKVDINDPSFACHIKLFDVYGGQPVPNNFTVSVFPLSASFDEGVGRDVVFYQDLDVCNFISSSRNPASSWIVSGAGSGGDASGSVDYITNFYVGASNINAKKTQTFIVGTEDLYVDVTNIVSATLIGAIPDAGYRISLDEAHENDLKTYFVKRFASRHAYDRSKRPQLIVRFDDSIVDDSSNLIFDATGSLFVNNFAIDGSPSSFLSGATSLGGNNCIMLKLVAQVSGNHNFFFTGSQYKSGNNFVDGKYFAQVSLSSIDAKLSQALNVSGSVNFIPVWTSVDGSLTYLSGSKINVKKNNATSKVMGDSNFIVNVADVLDEYTLNDTATLRVNIFDNELANVQLVKTPFITPTVVIRKTYYSIRDAVSNEIIIPFDEDKNSTRCSSDALGMYFKLDTSSLVSGRSYVIDVLVNKNGVKRIYKAASPTFKIR